MAGQWRRLQADNHTKRPVRGKMDRQCWTDNSLPRPLSVQFLSWMVPELHLTLPNHSRLTSRDVREPM